MYSRGYADGEIEALFAKYDIDGDRVLDEDEQRRMQADLDDQKVTLQKYFSIRFLLKHIVQILSHLTHLLTTVASIFDQIHLK